MDPEIDEIEPYFDRFDICHAYYLIEIEFHISGVLQERKSNIRRRMSTDFQLHRMGFRQHPGFVARLSENAQAIYDCLLRRYGFEGTFDSIHTIR